MHPILTKLQSRAAALACAVSVTLSLAGCGSDDPPADEGPSASASIGAAGGTLVGPDGVQMDVPAGALDTPTTLTIRRSAAGAPALPASAAASAGPVYEVTPHGLTFRQPAVLTLPVPAAAASAAADGTLEVLRAQPAAQWDDVDAPVATADGRISVALPGLSYYTTASSNTTRRGGVIGTSIGWAAPAPGIERPDGSVFNPVWLVAEATRAGVVVSSTVDPWCGGSVEQVATMYRDEPGPTYRRTLLQTQRATVATGSELRASSTFQFDIPVSGTATTYLFGRSARCVSPQVKPADAPYYASPPSPSTLEVLAADVARPTITVQPADFVAQPGDMVTLTVGATAPDELVLRWQSSLDGVTAWGSASASPSADGAAYTFTLGPRPALQRWRVRVCNRKSGVLNCLLSATVGLQAPAVTVPFQADSLIAGGGVHSLAISNAGVAWSWGSNNGGALGRASADNAPQPLALSNVRSVAAGAWYAVALRSNGEVLAWGWGGNVGQAIGGSGQDNPLPVRVAGLPGARAIATRYQHTLVLAGDGTVWGFGPESSGALGAPVGHQRARAINGLVEIRQVAAGERHSLALDANGRVWSWGDNGVGQLGMGTADTGHADPRQVPGMSDVVAIASSGYASFALRADGSVWSWGLQAQVGRSGSTTVPGQVAGPGNATRIAAAHAGGWLLRADGSAAGWGGNGNGQAGIGTAGGVVAAPATLPGLAQVVQMATGEFHGLALRADGTVLTWGGNGARQLAGLPGADRPQAAGSGFDRAR